MAKFTKIPINTFEKLQLNAGVFLKSFAPDTATVGDTDIVGATSGGANFQAKPIFIDRGAGIDNCPQNTWEMKDLDYWDISMTGTFVTVDTASAKMLLAAADVSGEKIALRNYLKAEDFTDLWWVGDYSSENSEEAGGFIAIHMMNTLSTGGFSMQSADKEKGSFAFTFGAHISIVEPNVVPCEIYIKTGVKE